MAHSHTSFGDYVLAALLLGIILLVAARAFLRAIGLRPPAKQRVYIEVPQAVTYVVQSDRDVVQVDRPVFEDALRERILEDEAALLPDDDAAVITHLYR